jgi:hypothetical protein
MNFNATQGDDMNTIQTRTEQIYFDLKIADRMTPGRTPWQTLRKRAEEIAAREDVWANGEISVENRNLSRAWSK